MDALPLMLSDAIQTAGGLATAVGVFLAWIELRRAKRQALTDFEDEFPREYRKLSQEFPVKALLGEDLEVEEYRRAQGAFFHYIDLCNEQVFLRQNRRVSTTTWASWCGGIRSNLSLPAFARAWEEIKVRTNQFAELRRLEESGFTEDPVLWGHAHFGVGATISSEGAHGIT